MTTISATAARNDLYNLIAKANEECKPINITNQQGKGAVLIGEDEWSAIEETLYLNTVPGLVSNIQKGLNEPLDECVSLDELEW